MGSQACFLFDGFEEAAEQQLHQFHGQDSQLGPDQASRQESTLGPDQASRQKFQYILAAPISVATKISEDTMTYLNQGQAYEIKLENITDLSEAKKGFMCSIISIGFHERHMQQAENELWQQWSQQRPSERIFSVDMKLSYNVFGVEYDGLNKYEFLWDSSKAAGVFIRINSISTEFTPRKHGGEKGIPFKLSIETFSYNSKTHDSYFISAACCQIKVFKPKGAERKIRSDRDKIFKRPPSEQVKYHQSCDHTVFHECSLISLHPLAAGSLGYYRHSHGHFGSKKVGSNTASSGGPALGGGAAVRSAGANQTSGASSDSSNNNGNNNQNTDNAQGNNGSNNENPSSSNPSPSHHYDHHHQDSDNGRNDAATISLHRHQTGGGGSGRGSGRGSDSEASSSHHNTSATTNNNSSNNNTNNSHNSANQQQQSRTHTDYSTSRLLQPYHHHHHHHNHHHPHNYFDHSNYNQGGDEMAGFNGSGDGANEGAGQQPSVHSPSLYYSTTGNGHSHNINLRSVSSLANSHHNDHQSSTPFGSYYGHSLVGPSQPPAPPPPPPPPPGSSTNSYSQTVGTPFKASNLAISSHHHHHQPHHNFHADAKQALQGSSSTSSNSSKDHHLVPTYPNHHHHHHHSHADHLNTGSDNDDGEGNGTSNAMPINGPGFADGYGSPDEAHQSHHHHHGGHHNQVSHHPAWSLGGSSSCASRGCISESFPPLGRNHQHHHHLSHHHSQPHLHNHQQQLHQTNLGHNSHYTEQQDSPHKSHHSNDSPESCYSSSRYRNNNTMSPYSSQIPQQQDLFDELAHPLVSLQASQAMTTALHHDDDDDDEHHDHHQHLQVAPLTLKSDCAEVLAWLVANRFGLFTKTFLQFNGADLLRLSKSELIEICGIADGIRLFNSLHNAPCIKPKKRNFRTIKFAQIKRELRIKRKLK